MANTIPCPNPACPHDFTAAELQAATALQCPKCGFRMQGKAAAPPPKAKPAEVKPKPVVAKPKPAPKPPPAKPVIATPVVAAPNAKVAMATPLPPQTKPAADVPPAQPAPAPSVEESLPDGGFFNPNGTATGPLVQDRKPPKKPFNWARLAINICIVGFALSVVVGAIVGVLWLMLGSGFGERSYGHSFTGTMSGQRIYRLALPRTDWSIDTEVQSNFGAHSAWKHNEYDFWFAIVVKDFVAHKPRDAEMLRTGIEKLESHFGDAIELDKMAQPGKIGEHAAQKLKFKGQAKAAFWSGECYMFFHNGVAYWLYLASPDWNTVEHFATELPSNLFSVLSDRRGWREQPLPTETFTSENNKLTMMAPKGVWEKHPAKNEDQNGEMFLIGRHKEKDNRKNALMLVALIEKKEDLKDAVKAARDYVENIAKTENANNKVVHAAEVVEGQTDLGSIENIGNRRGRIVDLRMQLGDEPMRYYLLAVVNDTDACYVIRCECAWASRQIWRQDFFDLLRTFQWLKKGE